MSNQDNLFEHDESLDEEIEWVSKTQLKREAKEVQDVARDLAALSNAQLEKLQLNDEIMASIDEFKRIKKADAQNRHLRYMARLLRALPEMDEIIEKAERFKTGSQAQLAQLNKLERWRERLINGSNQDFQAFVEQFPTADIQHLRQLIRNAQKEAKQEPPKTVAAKKLFKQLREIAES